MLAVSRLISTPLRVGDTFPETSVAKSGDAARKTATHEPMARVP